MSLNIQVALWVRGYQTALEGLLTGLFATMRTEERETLFTWVGPLTEGTVAILELHGCAV